MPALAPFFATLTSDPFLLYTLLAALFLALVSLVSGWAQLDFIAVFAPQGLFHVALAVLAAFALLLLSTSLGDTTGFITRESFQSISRFPLWVLTLAYGPSAGLLAAGLFAAFATSTTLPGWPEAVLALELVVLGWFAMAPSPRDHRWAGPLNAFLAYILAWSTGGAALLQALSENGSSLAAHLSLHQGSLGLLLGLLLLSLIGPGSYRRWFPGSRIKPRAKGTVDASVTEETSATPSPAAHLTSLRRRKKVDAGPDFLFGPLDEKPRRRAQPGLTTKTFAALPRPKRDTRQLSGFRTDKTSTDERLN